MSSKHELQTKIQIRLLSPSARVSRAFNKATIGGNNLFGGPYDRTGCIGFTIDDEQNWQMIWKAYFGREAPGPLPEGAMAVMTAQHYEGDPVTFWPKEVTLERDKGTIHWERAHIAERDGKANSRFAVLILPRVALTQVFKDVYRNDAFSLQIRNNRPSI